MVLVDWDSYEVLDNIKLNSMSVRKGTDADQLATPNHKREAGDMWYNQDRKVLQCYQSGTGNTFKVTELTNLLYSQETKIGVGSFKVPIHEKTFINFKGKMNSRVFVSLKYIPYTNVAGEVEARITSGNAVQTESVNFVASATPTAVYKTFILDSSSFNIDAEIIVNLLGQNVSVQFVEFRSC